VPYRVKLTLFILLSVGAAFLAVATPVLAGQVVDVIVADGSTRTVVMLAVIIAVVAVADAAVSMATRWYSANIGEGVILDLRTAVFNHVQKMPIAFFTRTRTGALVSRLNNDVIGAQQAFSGTLSGVVSNTVALALTLIVMLSTSWLVTVLAVIMLPCSSCPPGAWAAASRRCAVRRRPQLRHEHADDRAVLRAGRHPREAVRPPRRRIRGVPGRGGRVRDIGVRMAMLQYVFFTALMLVSALALALVYGLGGFLALGGQLETARW
jgi:ATP-binding cassette subfamily C protein